MVFLFANYKWKLNFKS